jgi:hypothetical protein
MPFQVALLRCSVHIEFHENWTVSTATILMTIEGVWISNRIY